LYIWLRTGERVPVTIPDGCLLVQAAKQIEYLTGGHIFAGFHEVVISDSTLEAIRSAEESGKSTWRVSSTLFSGLKYNGILEPLPPFNNVKSILNDPGFYKSIIPKYICRRFC